MKALIADDHELFRGGVKQLLTEEFEDIVVLEAGGLDEALERLLEHAPVDLLVMDLNMPGVEGMDSIAALSDAYPDAKLVVLSASEDRRDVLDALGAGINGYIPKSLSAGEIAAALRDVLDGRVFVPRAIARRGEAVPPRAKAAPPAGLDNLTERQRHVLDELMFGKSSKEIARALDVAEGTVKIHLAAIYRALGVKSRAEAIAKVSASR
ncbi:MAG: response regulator [Hyphomonadaceae bacterium]